MSPGWGSVLVLLGALALYVVTCAPGPVWQDSGMLQWRVLNHDVQGRLGLALAHPLFYLLAIGGKWVLWGEPAWRVNVVGAALGALGVASVFLLVRLWTGRAWAALVSAATLGVMHTYWRHAALPETYDLYVALLLGELSCLVAYARTGKRGWVYGLALVNGLAVATHMLGVLSLAVWLVLGAAGVWASRLRWRDAALCVGLWSLGALPYLWLIGSALAEGQPAGSVLHSAAFGQSWAGAVLNRSLSTGLLRENVLLFGYNFATPNVLLAMGGLAWLFGRGSKRWLGWVLVALMVLYGGFAGRYTVADRYAFFLPFYALTAVLVGLGAAWAAQRWSWTGRWRAGVLLAALLPVAAYAAGPPVAERAGVSLGTRRELPYRNDYRWFLQPWKRGYQGPARFAKETFETVGAGSIVYADQTTVYPLLYAQVVHGQGRDVAVVSNVVHSEAAPALEASSAADWVRQGRLYVVTPTEGYCPAFLLAGYDFERAGTVWRVAARRGDGAPGQASEAGAEKIVEVKSR